MVNKDMAASIIMGARAVIFSTSWGSMPTIEVVNVVIKDTAASTIVGTMPVIFSTICVIISEIASPRSAAAPASPFNTPRKALAIFSTPGTRSPSSSAPSSFTSVKTGSNTLPSSARDFIHFSFASLARMTSALVARYFSAASP